MEQSCSLSEALEVIDMAPLYILEVTHERAHKQWKSKAKWKLTIG